MEDNTPTTREENQGMFLELIKAGANDSQACAALGIGRTTLYRWKLNDPDFAARCKVAREISIDQLVKEAERRALHGSDKMLEFMLCNYAPDRFKRAQAVDVNMAAKMTEAEIKAELLTILPLLNIGNDLI